MIQMSYLEVSIQQSLILNIFLGIYFVIHNKLQERGYKGQCNQTFGHTFALQQKFFDILETLKN